ncbi:restriction endonuclease subunit S, partial [Corynebacterium sp. AOP40-4SA-5]|uniref:restriction endonuclease subunit S n=1 Tax=Corynebacterium sp. AOP40-4SA-5 TaxID=3457678 RepID=UPI0040332123
MSTPRVRLKYACVSRGKYGLNYPSTGYVDQGIRLIRTTDLAGGVLSPAELGIYVPEGAVDDESRLMPGDLLLSRSGTIGRAFLAPPATEGMAFAGFLVRFRPKPDTLGKYIYYCTQSNEFQAAVNADAVSSTIKNFNAEKYENLAVPLPELDEQRVIADYLDRETQKIDELITEQRGFIEKLSERRRSLVTRLVTRGIDDNVEIAEVSNKWLDFVPTQWKVTRFRFVAKIDNVMVDPRGTRNMHDILIAPNHIERDTGRLLAIETADEQGADSNKFRVREGQIIFSKIRPTL